MDTREVMMFSTVHQAYTGQIVRRKVKEAGVWKNNPFWTALWTTNRTWDVWICLMHYSDITVPATRQPSGTRLFYCFLDITVVNSFLFHKELFKFRQDPTQTKPLTNKIFREQLAKEMLEFAEGSATSVPPPLATTCMIAFFDSEETRDRMHCKSCHDAGINSVRTAVYCRRCKVHLCLSSKKNCFQLWNDGQ